jgi:hypothetical protein
MSITRTSQAQAYVTGSKLAEVFPVWSQRSWWEHLRSGALPSAKVGHRRVVKVSDVEAFLEGRLNQSGEAVAS